MEFHQLRIFLEVARQKNFTRAAENLFLSQPTVSVHIKKLEEALDTPLFRRGKEGMELTEAGRLLFQYGQELLETRAEALAAIQQEQRVIRGRLEIAASSVPGAYLLPDLLQAFCVLHPQVSFSISLRDSRQVLQSIADCSHDLGFTGEPGSGNALGQVMLSEDELILVASPSLACRLSAPNIERAVLADISLDDLADLPILLREPGSATRKVFEEALKNKGGRNTRLFFKGYLESQEAIKEAAKAGLGLTVISQRAVKDELKTGLLKGYRLKDLPLKRHFYLVFRKDCVLPPLSKSFFQFTCDYFTQEDRSIMLK
ncbi:MAG: LysR family transcriptional regulator [Clostridiaceae bacterium]|jgi:DNA-binding transcriptional LysR family regulator|nr:LysR family transcriptional regulator [Clostridiaceae bacterium]